MDSLPWPEQLRKELRRQSLPPWYIDRLVEELADHALDSQKEHASMEAQSAFERLGTATHLAAAARQEFDRRSFAGRHPVLTFVLGPIAFVPLLFVACMLLFFGVGWVIATGLEFVAPEALSQISDETRHRIEPWFAAVLNAYARFLPFALAAWLYCRLGRRGMNARWSLVACLITALIACLVFTKCTPAVPGNTTGLYAVGFTLTPNLRQLLQILPPLAIAAWFHFRNHSDAATFRLPSHPNNIDHPPQPILHC